MYKIITHEEAIKKMREINPNYTILSEFKGWRESVTRKCNICGDIRTVKARTIIEKNHGKLRACPVCAAKERAEKYRKTHKQFIEELKSINPNIGILTEYTVNDKKVKCKCLIDGFEWDATPHSLLGGHGCPECYRKRENRRTNEEFVSELKAKHPNIIPLEQFTLASKNIMLKCSICGYEWQTSPNVLLNREYSGCPKCINHAPVSEEEMIDRLSKCNPYVKYIDGYNGILPHANFECLKCGHKWSTSTNSVLHGRGCPKCNISHGEKEIIRILNSLKIDYKFQYKFDDCKNNRCLPFDFFIPSKNLCIEYDGIQHFTPVRFSKKSTEEEIKNSFESLKMRDEIKNAYCKDNDINLIRIPYTEYNNIENILNKYIS